MMRNVDKLNPGAPSGQLALITRRSPLKVMCIHAHFDDFEFVAAGTFLQLKERLGEGFRGRVVVCTDGRAGHQFRTREETGKLRLQEQALSASLGGYEFEQLLLPSGQPPREACLQVDVNFKAALWHSIRKFEPDYIFCPPPLPADPRVGVHNDHVAVATAIREVAYMINVPHAFTPEYPANERQSKSCKVPVILTVHDSYMGGGNHADIAISVEDKFKQICALAWCHASQVKEWLPWVGRHGIGRAPTKASFLKDMRVRFRKANEVYGIHDDVAREFFMTTTWGEPPQAGRLRSDFPIDASASNLRRLAESLRREEKASQVGKTTRR